MKRIYVDPGEMKTLRLFFRDFNVWHIVGSHSITVPSLGTKVILRSVCKPWTDQDGQTYLMTPGEAARVELDRAFPGLKRVGWLGPEIRLFSMQVPLLFTGPYKGELWYVDLSGAYQQIYRYLWLDVLYPCGRGIHSLAPVADALANWKQARNSVVGICRSRSATGIKGTRVCKLSTNNRFLSPCLWASVVGILQCLASIAARPFRSCYINTDGYLFKSYDDFRGFTAALASWGFKYTTQEGPGEIRSWGSYRVGQKKAGQSAPPSVASGHLSTLQEPFPGLLDWFIREKERQQMKNGSKQQWG